MNAITGFSCFAGLPRVDEVLALLAPRLATVSAETVPLREAAGRILARAAQAAKASPPADRSAMDGYAFRFGDGPALRLVGEALAGKPFAGVVGEGECVAIATGASIPAGCDSVAMREHCQLTSESVVVHAKARGANIRRAGEDFPAGAPLLQPGTRIGARQIGLLASAGVKSVEVHRPLRVALLSLGNELADAAPDGICDVNRPLLATLCAGNDFAVSDFGILADDRKTLARKLGEAAVHHDVILTTGGSAAGDEDHARAAILGAGGRLLIAGVAIKPGKPVSIGEIGGALVMALPGNPAAAYVAFLILALPLLAQLSGCFPGSTPWQSFCAGFDHQKKPGLREYLRVRMIVDSGGVPCLQRCGGDGSAMLASLADADGLIVLEEESIGFCKGEAVDFASFAALERL